MTSQPLDTIEMNDFVATIKRTSRKGSVGFRLSSGKVVILAPRDIPMSQIRLILESKSHIIIDKLNNKNHPPSQASRVPSTKRAYVSGEKLAYLDSELVLQVSQGGFSTQVVDLHNINVSVPAVNSEWVRNALIRWYKLQAQKHIAQRVSYFAPMVGAWPKAIEIKTYKARWGSCTSKGLVQFNWKIMMAPSAVVDSIVVHELCHLLHMHHGPDFWAQVVRVFPAYQDAKQWLKDEGHHLGLD